MSLFLIGIGIAGFVLQDNFPTYVEKKIFLRGVYYV